MIHALWVVLGAALWATDTLFRHPLIQQLSPLTIVFFEHVVATGLSLGLLLLIRQNPFRLNLSQFSAAFLIGALGSAVATLLFTASFHFVNPTITILLQKVQPILVVMLSFLFLGERPNPRFWKWAALALIAAFVMSFPNGIESKSLAGIELRGAGLALGAAGMWAISTVVGKNLLQSVPSETLTFWRFFFGLLASVLLVRLNPQAQLEIPFVWVDTGVLKSLSAMAALSGLLGVGLYYRGLSKIPASAATILELSFPLAAMWINSTFLNLHLSMVQWMAALFLMLAMVGVGRTFQDSTH